MFPPVSRPLPKGDLELYGHAAHSFPPPACTCPPTTPQPLGRLAASAQLLEHNLSRVAAWARSFALNKRSFPTPLQLAPRPPAPQAANRDMWNVGPQDLLQAAAAVALQLLLVVADTYAVFCWVFVETIFHVINVSVGFLISCWGL